MKLLEINSLNIYYKKKNKKNYVIKDFSFSMNEGEIIALIGKSGIGKTTIAKTIMGLHSLYEGDIFLNINKEDIQYIFQDPYSSLNPYMNISYIISEGMEFKNSDEKDKEIKRVLNLVRLDDSKRFCYPREFSGGERQKIAIARALIRKPKLIIADEITSQIDYHSKITIIELLRNLQKTTKFACLIISHDHNFINKLTDKVIDLSK